MIKSSASAGSPENHPISHVDPPPPCSIDRVDLIFRRAASAGGQAKIRPPCCCCTPSPRVYPCALSVRCIMLPLLVLLPSVWLSLIGSTCCRCVLVPFMVLYVDFGPL